MSEQADMERVYRLQATQAREHLLKALSALEPGLGKAEEPFDRHGDALTWILIAAMRLSRGEGVVERVIARLQEVPEANA